MTRKLLVASVLLALVWTELTPFGVFASSRSIHREEARDARHQQACELVELYPGYPGYRGLVAGLVGYAETACLKDLEASNLTFSQQEQDQENDRIAAQLGIPGTKLDRTWEAWLAIGAARGYSSICYSCSLLDLPMPIIDGTGVLGPSDPRIQLSSWLAQPAFASRYFLSLGSESGSGTPEYMQDRWLRPVAYAMIPSLESTNSDLLRSAEKVVSDYFCLSGGDCTFLDSTRLACFFIERGGYVVPPLGIHWIDRAYLMSVALLAAGTVGSSGLGDILFQHAMDQYFSGLERNPQADPVELARTSFTQC